MDGLLGTRATWLAALGAGLSALQQLVFTVLAIRAARAEGDFHPEFFVVRALNVVAMAAWSWYFLSLYRAQRGRRTLAVFHRSTVVALVLIFGIRTFLLWVEALSSMFFDLAGILTIAIAGLSIVLWIVVLVVLGFGRLREHLELAPTPLIAITVLQSLGAVSALLRLQVSLESVTGFVYAATQILFLIALKSDPDGMIPAPRITLKR